MPRILPIAIFAALVLPGAVLPGAALAAPAPGDDPSPYLQAFRDTCLTAFPDFDTIARKATEQGWQDSKLTVRGDPKDLPMSLPRAFRKDGMMLFLTTIDSGPLQRVCQIAGTAATKLRGADVAEVVSPVLGGAAPEPVRSRREDAALWTTAPGISVQAGIAIYGRMRTLTFSVRQQR
ncbi:hypothetical protein [Sphingomonas sp.]|uniref:hypothetical protein n=1 Tax=Sphingomonas sp. TaxID=28214 RepID=UPI000DB2E931|nr:hypothetical protein [Sphingomonas sp.]PZU11771.1 MAG: hypothetical protein DI605_02020 [Sphingomonas sp.]